MSLSMSRLGISNTARLLIYGKKTARIDFCNQIGLSIAPYAISKTLNINGKACVTSRLYHSLVYSVSLKTGDRIGAGTDSQVFIRMVGDKGSTDELTLATETDHLERGRLDHYSVESDDVGSLRKLIVRHDNSGFAPGWFLEWVKVRDGRGKRYHFDCNDWLSKGEKYASIKLLKERSYDVQTDVTSNVADHESQDHQVSTIEDQVVNAEAADYADSVSSGITDKSGAPSSQTNFPILKDDVPALIEKENIRKKIFTLKVDVDVTTTEEISSDKSLSDINIPHLYMSTTCDVTKLDSFVDKIDQKVYRSTRKSVLAKIFSQSLFDSNILLNNEDCEVLINRNGNSRVVKNCRSENISNMSKQLSNFKDSDDTVIIPSYTVNVNDQFNVTQLSTILRIGQVVTMNVNGPKLDVDADGKVVEYLILSICCDMRIISEVTCAMLLLNCKRYISNPKLLKIVNY